LNSLELAHIEVPGLFLAILGKGPYFKIGKCHRRFCQIGK